MHQSLLPSITRKPVRSVGETDASFLDRLADWTQRGLDDIERHVNQAVPAAFVYGSANVAANTGLFATTIIPINVALLDPYQMLDGVQNRLVPKQHGVYTAEAAVAHVPVPYADDWAVRILVNGNPVSVGMASISRVDSFGNLKYGTTSWVGVLNGNDYVQMDLISLATGTSTILGNSLSTTLSLHRVGHFIQA